MTHPRSATTTIIAILGPDTLAEDILVRLLEREGYAVRSLGAYPSGVVDELLDGADLLLLAPGLDSDVRGAFLETMRSAPQTAATPVLPLPPALKVALLDELSASAPWRSLFEELTGQIGAALERAAASAGALLGVASWGGRQGAGYPTGCSLERRAAPLLKGSQNNPSNRTLRPKDLLLPPGYRLDYSDPHVLTLLSP